METFQRLMKQTNVLVLIGNLTTYTSHANIFSAPDFCFFLSRILFSPLFLSLVSSPDLCLNVILQRGLPGPPYIKSMPPFYSSSEYTIYLFYGIYHYLLLHVLFTGLLPFSLSSMQSQEQESCLPVSSLHIQLPVQNRVGAQ